MNSFQRKWSRFEIASWKSSDSIKSDLPIKSEGRALKGFTSSHFFSPHARKFRRKIVGRIVRMKMAAARRLIEKSIDRSIRWQTSRIMAASRRTEKDFSDDRSRDTAINFFLVSRYALSLTESFYINIFSITF